MEIPGYVTYLIFILVVIAVFIAIVFVLKAAGFDVLEWVLGFIRTLFGVRS